jgi:GMP synthase-like glutamine amidotransferase
MKPLLLLRQEPEDDLGIALDSLAGPSLAVVRIDAWDAGSAWPALDDVSGLVVFGGSMNCDQTDRYPWLARERALVADAIRSDLPVLGVCLGAQLLVRALDQPVVQARTGRIGFQEIRLTGDGRADPVLAAMPDRAQFFQWHEDEFRLPPEAKLLATDDEGGVQGFRFGLAWGVQFHPEVTGPELDRWFQVAADAEGRVWGRSPVELRSEVSEHLPAATVWGREMFARFAGVVVDNQIAARSS